MHHRCPDVPLTRRELLRRAGTGLGLLGMAGIMLDAGGLVLAGSGHRGIP